MQVIVFLASTRFSGIFSALHSDMFYPADNFQNTNGNMNWNAKNETLKKVMYFMYTVRDAPNEVPLQKFMKEAHEADDFEAV